MMVLQLPERCYCADVVSKEPHFFPAAEQMRLHGLLWFVGDGKPSALADYSYRHLGLPLSYSTKCCVLDVFIGTGDESTGLETYV